MEREVIGVPLKCGEFHGDGIIEPILVSGAIDGHHVDVHFRGAIGSGNGGQAEGRHFVLGEVARPVRGLLRSTIHRVADDGGGEGLGAEVAQVDLEDDVASAAQHAFRSAGDTQSEVQRKRGHAPFTGVAVEHFESQAEGVQMLRNAVVEADAHAAIVVELAIVHVAGTGGGSTVQLADDAVVLVKEGRARRSRFSHAVFPLVNPPHRRTGGIVVVRGVFLETDLLEVSTWMVDACGVLHGFCIRSIPAGIEDVVAGRWGFIEHQQAEIRSAAAHQQLCAADGLVGGPSVAGAAFRLVVEDKRPIAHIATQTVVGGEEQGGAILGGVVDQCAGADGKTAVENEGHRPLLALPGGAFRTVHIDVAVPAVSIGAALLTQGFRHQGRLAGNVPVSVNHLVDAQGHGVFPSLWNLHFHDHAIACHEARGQAAPILHVAVVKPPDEFDSVCAPNEHFGPFG